MKKTGFIHDLDFLVTLYELFMRNVVLTFKSLAIKIEHFINFLQQHC